MAGKRKNISTFGTYSISLFWYILFSGILLAIPFNVESPYLSISSIMVDDPFSSVIRNFHFWSSQFFLIFSLIHIFEHFHYKEKIGLKPWKAFRLSLGIFILFMAMLTGFLLKADSDSLQARHILETLAVRIPLVGEALAYSLLGFTDNFLLIYVHHIATFTIFLLVVMVEHSRKFWPKTSDFIITFFGVLLFSLLFTAPLHDNLNPSVKGPWYFVGFQEILHLLKYPVWSVLLVVLITALAFIVNSGKGKIVFFSKRTLLFLAGIYLLLTLFGLFFRGERWDLTLPWHPGYKYSVLNNFKTGRVDLFPEKNLKKTVLAPEIMGRKEGCLFCHSNTKGFTDSHKPEAIGCYSCHGGNPFTTAKNPAHRNMHLIPGNLDNSKASCGTTQCHPEIAERVPTGLMSTLSGMISVDRFVFGEQDNPDELTSVHELGKTAADAHLNNQCVICHLGNPKTEYGPVHESSRGGGCLACHLNYSEKALSALRNNRTKLLTEHPEVSLNVTNNHCFGCHSRSGRIATNYEGWHETTLQKNELPANHGYRLVEGERVFEKQPEDIHHKLGMECIDCHHSYELMGDGKHYAHQEEQQDVQCTDCHVAGKPETVELNKMDNESAIIASLRFGNAEGKKFLVTKKHMRPLINTIVDGDSLFLFTKNSGLKKYMKPPADACVRDSSHSSLSCSACHSSWAPSCIGCHNQYAADETGYDMLNNREMKGNWVEYSGTFTARQPALGIRKTSEKREIIPVIPGMILTIDLGSYPHSENKSTIFRRMYAPAAPHTTAKIGRSCKSCHNSSFVLGFGEGSLVYKTENGEGKWIFDPVYANNKNDGLPEDAWTGFLQNREGEVSTRKNVAPFTVEEQKKILLVGACLTCHTEDSNVMKQSLFNFEGVFAKRSSKCIIPAAEFMPGSRKP